MVNNGSLTRSQHDRSKELHYYLIVLQRKHHTVPILIHVPMEGIFKVQTTMSVILIAQHFIFEDSFSAEFDQRPFVP